MSFHRKTWISLSDETLRLRAIGDPASPFPRTKKSTKFDSEALHDDAVNQAYSTHKDAIESHFANGGGYKEWDIDLGRKLVQVTIILEDEVMRQY